MKRIILFILLLASPCFAAEPIQLAMSPGFLGSVGAGGGAAPPSCTPTTIFDDTGISEASSDGVKGTAGSRMMRKFTISGTKTVTKYTIHIKRTFTSGNITAALYLTTGSPATIGTIVADTSVTKPYTDFTYNTFGNYDFTLATSKSGLSGDYFLVLTTDDETNTFGGVPYGASTGIRSFFSGASGYITGYTLGMSVTECTP